LFAMKLYVAEKTQILKSGLKLKFVDKKLFY
jgi:hypothetical protein